MYKKYYDILNISENSTKEEVNKPQVNRIKRQVITQVINGKKTTTIIDVVNL